MHRFFLKYESILQQMKKLLRCREKVRDTKNELLEIQNRLIGLRKLMNEHLAKRYKLLDRLLENLKPIQAARFFLWVSKNSSCMQMLQTVWKIPERPSDMATVKMEL